MIKNKHLVRNRYLIAQKLKAELPDLIIKFVPVDWVSAIPVATIAIYRKQRPELAITTIVLFDKALDSSHHQLFSSEWNNYIAENRAICARIDSLSSSLRNEL